ncbi:MAG: hypothetical protein MUQ32_03155, partial [Chloroflexi bacterium]|nr:hypothetical protein [Chloroflexota bacterium]
MPPGLPPARRSSGLAVGTRPIFDGTFVGPMLPPLPPALPPPRGGWIQAYPGPVIAPPPAPPPPTDAVLAIPLNIRGLVQ